MSTDLRADIVKALRERGYHLAPGDFFDPSNPSVHGERFTMQTVSDELLFVAEAIEQGGEPVSGPPRLVLLAEVVNALNERNITAHLEYPGYVSILMTGDRYLALGMELWDTAEIQSSDGNTLSVVETGIHNTNADPRAIAEALRWVRNRANREES